MSVNFEEVYVELLSIVHDLGADLEEDFFSAKASQFDGTQEEFLEHVRQLAPTWYMSLGATPNWLQEPQWQYFDGRPMVFVGELRKSAEETGLHDESCFYVFWDRESGVTATVVQVA